MSGLDLSGVVAVLDQWLVDEVVVVRDSRGDDQLNPETLQLENPGPRAIYVGPGAIQPIGGFSERPDPDVQRVMAETDAEYRLLAPLSADLSDVQVGDDVWIAIQRTTTTDPRLTDRVFRVVEAGAVSTFAVAQFVYLVVDRIVGPGGVPETPPWPTPPEEDVPDLGLLLENGLT